MSIIETLTEGMVQRDMRKEGEALLNKWTQTGLLEGLADERQRSSMARLLENQAKELLRESSTMAAGDVEGFAAVAFPIVRRVFAGLIANDLVSVQPMSLPSGLIFFLDFTFGTAGLMPRLGNTAGDSIYGGDRVGAQITGGVNLVDATLKSDGSGPLRGGAVGYAYASPSGTLEVVKTGIKVRAIQLIEGSISEADKKVIKYDPDILSLADSAGTYNVAELTLFAANIPSDLNRENLSAIQVTPAQFAGTTDGTSDARQLRRLSAIATGSTGDLKFFFVGDTTAVPDAIALDLDTNSGLTGSYPMIDGFENAGASQQGAIEGTATWGLEGEAEIPEIDIRVDSVAITAVTKKLKAKWTPELGQDLNAYHNLDAEVELTSILSEQIALEIDREILADLVNGATAGTFYWSRSPGLFVNRETGAELGATSAAPDFTGTVSEWYETLIETINDVSAQIHRKTLRGGANYVVVSPEVANVLEFTAGFRASVTADADKGDIGAVKVGSLSRKFDVIVDPYFPRNVVLVGRRGASFLESGYVYAPYVPLQVTPTIFGVEDFVPRKGVMTRYAKKMVRPDMYGLVIVRGLLGESGA